MNELKVVEYTNVLLKHKSIDFTYNGFYYEIFESEDSGYIVNLYGSGEKDKDGFYLDGNFIDGGVCYGNAMDVIKFMI